MKNILLDGTYFPECGDNFMTSKCLMFSLSGGVIWKTKPFRLLGTFL